MTERTYIMLKPDAVRRGLMGEIIGRIERKGYRITRMEMMELDQAILKEHYAHVTGERFYPAMEAYMMSGPVVAMIVEGRGVVSGMRRMMGATSAEERLAGTIRGDLASTNSENLIHGADSVENAEIEIKRFFERK